MLMAKTLWPQIAEQNSSDDFSLTVALWCSYSSVTDGRLFSRTARQLSETWNQGGDWFLYVYFHVLGCQRGGVT